MARKYDKIIRFYGSWFADLSDPDKALTFEERWQVIEVIVKCQEQETTEPINDLPLEIRRALSMATLREQLERILEKNAGARERGRKGAEVRHGEKNTIEYPETIEDLMRQYKSINDGADRNPEGLYKVLQGWRMSTKDVCRVIVHTDFGRIGGKVWTLIRDIQADTKIQRKGNYLIKCLFGEKEE